MPPGRDHDTRCLGAQGTKCRGNSVIGSFRRVSDVTWGKARHGGERPPSLSAPGYQTATSLIPHPPFPPFFFPVSLSAPS